MLAENGQNEIWPQCGGETLVVSDVGMEIITSILRSEYFEGKGWSRETALFYFMIVGIAETFMGF